MSSDLNKVVLVTRLTRDAELKYTNSGFAITVMSGAVNRSVKKNDQWVEECSFFDFKLLGKRGESLIQYLLKGSQLAIEGQLIQERWETEGQKRSKVVIQIDNIQLLGGKKDNQATNNNSSGGNNSYSKPVNGGKTGYQSNNGQTNDSFEDDIPF